MCTREEGTYVGVSWIVENNNKKKKKEKKYVTEREREKGRGMRDWMSCTVSKPKMIWPEFLVSFHRYPRRLGVD